MGQMNKTMISLKTHARLHMGFLDMHGGLGRKFGSLGLSLNAPSLVMHAMEAEELRVVGNVDVKIAEDVVKMLKTLQKSLNLQFRMQLSIEQSIPRHAGLGSGTQLAIGLVAVVNALYRLNLSQHRIAQLSSRGARSGIGLGAFFQGGALVDAGRGSTTGVPPIIARAVFPEDWYVILIADNSQQGIHGALERATFEHLPAFAPSLAEKLCHHVLMQALPALHEQDLPAFGGAVRALQMATGEHFAAAQGGLYASDSVEKALNYLVEQGVTCFGQSSWGPTGFAIVESEMAALELLGQLQMAFEHLTQLSFSVCAGNNQGAQLDFV